MRIEKVAKYFYPYRILDIGANVGKFHALCKSFFPSSYIFSIEASESCLPFLKKVTNNYKICLLGKENKDCHKLDDILPNEKFDLIKIDTQGSEIDIIKGGINLISKASGVLLAPLQKEVFEFMTSINFTLTEALEDHVDGSGNIFQRDYLFMNKRADIALSTSIYNMQYVNNNERNDVLDYLRRKKFKRVIDIGVSASSWSYEFLSHYVDIVKLDDPSTNLVGFIGNVCTYKTWQPILEDVKKNGKFDFVICSHTLEDISSPLLVKDMINEIGKEGFIAVPSKNMELSKGSDSYGSHLGWVHHRWIYDIEDKKFMAYPKLNFVEILDWSSIKCKYDSGEVGKDIKEIRFFWRDNFDIDFVNGDLMGPKARSVYKYFERLNR